MAPDKTREELKRELDDARRRIAGLEAALSIRVGLGKDGGQSGSDSSRMLSQVLDAIPARVFWKDEDLAYLGCNRAFAADAGLASPSVIVGMNDFQMPWAAQAGGYRADDAKVIRTGSPKIGYEEPQTTPSGDTIWLRTSKVPLLDASGRIRGVLGTYEDITAEKKAREALAESEEKYKAIVAAFDGQMYTCSAGQRILYMNQALIDRVGRDATGESCHEALHGMASTCPWCVSDKVFDGETVRWEVLSPADGRWYYVVNAPIFLDGKVVSKLAMITDITERKKAEDALKESRERYRIVADNTYDWEFWFGPTGDSLYQSPSCERVTGRSAALFMKEPGLLERIIHPDDLERFRRHQADVTRTRASGAISFRILLPDGRERHIEHLCQPVFGHGGEYLGVRGSNRDVTESRMIREELRQAKEAAEEASRAKSAFLANMSHEIRTPMNAILGLSKLVLKRPLSTEQREFMEGVMDAGGALMQIINDILDFSKIEAGRMELDNEPFSVRRLMEKVMRTFAVLASRKGIALEFRIGTDIPDMVRGDEGRLRQILVNLVGNAVKFTQRGEVVCTVDMESPDLRPEDAPEGPRLIFTVKDTGIGIPRDKLDSIFDSFTQADISTTKQFGGTGLGLAICRSLVGMMRGRIWVESAVGRGASFSFTAGFESASQPGEALRPQPGGVSASVARGGPLNILLAEDDKLNQMFMEIFLKEAGHQVSIASNGREVLSMLDCGPFDLIIMDISMPVMDGEEATRIIRARPTDKGGDIPIVAMTAHALKGDRERFIASGMTDYIAKPADMDTVLAVLGRMAAKERETPGVQAKALEPAGELLDCHWIVKQYDLKREAWGKLVPLYLAELPRHLTNMRMALDAGDAKTLTMSAHSLKGASGVVGAAGVARQAALLEQAGRSMDLPQARVLMAGLESIMEATAKALPEALS